MHLTINISISLVYRKPNFLPMLRYMISKTQITSPLGGLIILHDKFLVVLVSSFVNLLLLMCKTLLNGVVALYMPIYTLPTISSVSLMHMFLQSHPTANKKDLTHIRISKTSFDSPSPPIRALIGSV